MPGPPAGQAEGRREAGDQGEGPRHGRPSRRRGHQRQHSRRRDGESPRPGARPHLAVLARPPERVAGEGRRDPPPDHEEQDDHEIDGEAQGAPRDAGGESERLRVHHAVGAGERQEDSQQRLVPVLPGSPKRAEERRRHSRQEREIQPCHQPARKEPRRSERQTAEAPQADECRQGAAHQRRTARPHGGGGEQEARDGRRHEPEHHLVPVPPRRKEPPGGGERPEPDEDPGGDRQRSVDRQAQEEGTEGPSPEAERRGRHGQTP